MVEKEMREEL